MKFYLLNINNSICWGTLRPHPYNDSGELVFSNPAGGFLYEHMIAKEDILEVVEVDDWGNLDWSKTTEYKEMMKFNEENKYKNDVDGWLSPSGEFFACKRANHLAFADLIFNKSGIELERVGWATVHFYHFFLFQS